MEDNSGYVHIASVHILVKRIADYRPVMNCSVNPEVFEAKLLLAKKERICVCTI